VSGDKNEKTLGHSGGKGLKKRELKSAKKVGLFDKSPTLTINRDRSPMPKAASGSGGGF